MKTNNSSFLARLPMEDEYFEVDGMDLQKVVELLFEPSSWGKDLEGIYEVLPEEPRPRCIIQKIFLELYESIKQEIDKKKKKLSLLCCTVHPPWPYSRKNTRELLEWCQYTCNAIGITPDRREMMKNNPKIVEMMAGHAKKAAAKIGYSKLFKNGIVSARLQQTHFLSNLSLGMKNLLTKNKLDLDLTEINKNWIESMEEILKRMSDPKERKEQEKQIALLKDVLNERDPLVTYRGGQIRYSKLDLEKCSVEKTDSGEYVAIDLYPKEKETAKNGKALGFLVLIVSLFVLGLGFMLA
uniref:Transposase n=1 Tax=Caenorhabditis tropicalis TaxID=1561998 RepID=A0A1I7TUD7_9PELO